MGRTRQNLKKDVIINEVVELRIKRGFSSVSIVEYLEDKWGIKKSQAYNYIKAARLKMGEIFKQVNYEPLKDSVMLMENMLQKAIGSGDNKLALDILKEMNKVNQLYVEKLDVTSGGDKIKNITFEIIPQKRDEKGDED